MNRAALLPSPFVLFQSTNASGSQRALPNALDSTRPTASHLNPNGNNIYNQNTTNNTNVQITQNTFNFNTNPSVSNLVQSQSQSQQPASANDTSRVLNQTIGSQTNVNVILNQTVIQQQQPPVQTTTAANQQQMFAININGNQTLIPLSMFTKLLQNKCPSTQQAATVGNHSSTSAARNEPDRSLQSPTVTSTVAQPTISTQVLQNGAPLNSKRRMA